MHLASLFRDPNVAHISRFDTDNQYDCRQYKYDCLANNTKAVALSVVTQLTGIEHALLTDSARWHNDRVAP